MSAHALLHVHNHLPNPLRFYQDPGFLTGPSACARLGFAPRQLGESQESEAADRTGAAGRVRAGVVVLWLVLSLVVPLGVGVLWLRAWARHADRMIWVSVGIHVGSFVTGAIVTFAVGAIPAGAVMLFMAVLVAVLWWVWGWVWVWGLRREGVWRRRGRDVCSGGRPGGRGLAAHGGTGCRALVGLGFGRGGRKACW